MPSRVLIVLNSGTPLRGAEGSILKWFRPGFGSNPPWPLSIASTGRENAATDGRRNQLIAGIPLGDCSEGCNPRTGIRAIPLPPSEYHSNNIPPLYCRATAIRADRRSARNHSSARNSGMFPLARAIGCRWADNQSAIVC